MHKHTHIHTYDHNTTAVSLTVLEFFVGLTALPLLPGFGLDRMLTGLLCKLDSLSLEVSICGLELFSSSSMLWLLRYGYTELDDDTNEVFVPIDEKESRGTSPFSDDSEPLWDSGSEFLCIVKIPMKRKHEAKIIIPITTPTAISPIPHAGREFWSNPPPPCLSGSLVVGCGIVGLHGGLTSSQ